MARRISFFENYFDIAEELSDGDRLAFYDAVMRYVFRDEEPDLSGPLRLVFMAVRPNLDASVNGSRGGRGRKAEAPSETGCAPDGKTASEEVSEKRETPFAKTEKGVSANSESPVIEKEGKGKGMERKAAADAAAAGAAAPSAHCPLCESKCVRNTNTGRWECTSCHDTWSADQAVWR